MSNKTFIIHFITSEVSKANGDLGRLVEYEALVTILSGSLALYKVSNILSVSGEKQVLLPNVFYLTSYPMQDKKHNSWLDPITLRTNKFIQILGETIELSQTNKHKLPG